MLKFNKILIFICILYFSKRIICNEDEDNLLEEELDNYNFIKKIKNAIIDFLIPFSVTQQSYFSVLLINSTTIPIFLLLFFYKFTQSENEYLSSFSAGCIVGDVFLHNIPEIFKSEPEEREKQKIGALIAFGVIVFFIIDKLIGILMNYSNENKLKIQKIILIMLGDIFHNYNDALAITSSYLINIRIGVIITLFNFFHEFPHKLGDFSLLIKQEVNLKTIMIMQIFIFSGSILGVYTALTLKQEYAHQILSFSSGGFLYISINTIFSDIKESTTLSNVFFTFIAYMVGIYFLFLHTPF